MVQGRLDGSTAWIMGRRMALALVPYLYLLLRTSQSLPSVRLTVAGFRWVLSFDGRVHLRTPKRLKKQKAETGEKAQNLGV